VYLKSSTIPKISYFIAKIVALTIIYAHTCNKYLNTVHEWWMLETVGRGSDKNIYLFFNWE
jgi:hypothetical protein